MTRTDLSLQEEKRRKKVYKKMTKMLIRLFPDAGRIWPLWGGPGVLLEPRDLGLSTELEDEIRNWQTVWEDHFNRSGDWHDAAVKAAWVMDGRRIASLIELELGADVSVRFDGIAY